MLKTEDSIRNTAYGMPDASGKLFSVFCLLFSVSCFLFTSATADPIPSGPADADSAELIYRVPPIIITAGRMPMPARDAAATITILSRADLARRSPENLAEALSGISGGASRSYGGGGGLHTFSIRGGMAAQTLVLLDGIRLANDLNGVTDGSLIPLALIEHIEIYKSGNSACYGADAVSGVINITTQATGSLRRISSEFGAFGLRRLTGQIRQPVAKMGQLALTLTDEAATGNFPYDFEHQRQTRQNADFHRQHGMLALTRQDSLGRALRWQTLWLDARIGVPGPVTSVQTDGKARQRDRNVLSQLQADWPFSARGLGQITFFWQQNRQSYRDDALVINGTPLAVQHNLDSGGARLEGRWQSADNRQFNAGYEYRRARGHSQSIQETRRHQHSLFVAAALKRASGSQWRFGLQPAVRLDYYSDFGTQLSPKIGFIAQHKQTEFYVNFGRSFRAPTFNDMYWRDGGNPDLQPERSRSFEVGLRSRGQWSGRLWEIQTAYFRQNVRDLIQWLPVTATYWRPVNLRDMAGRGWEAELRADLWDWLSFNGNFTVTHSQQHDPDPALNRRQLIYTPIYTANAELSSHWRMWRGGLNFQYVGQRFRTSDNSEALPAYRLLDAHIGTDVVIKQFHFLLRLEAQNFTQTIYQSVAGYPVPGREWRFKLSTQF